MSDSKEYNLWIEFAKNDLLVARELQIEKHFVYRAILTHSQQSIEKYLKAFLLFHKQSNIRIHDLLILCKISENYDETFLAFEKDLTWVSVNYMQSRYPDNFEDIDLEDAKQALNIATKFEKFILPKFD
ncbi:MAG: HEPN domain-containing protein [Bacteroidota bacterium]|nr:HEPN domain-containing protein [Bacteroidota bacterium]